MPKLVLSLAGEGIEVGQETLRQTLIGAGLSHQRTRSWKWSSDPDFAEKAERVLSLYRDRPEDGVVICFDEMGPIQLIPQAGSGWAPIKRSERLGATDNKRGGVRYLFGTYDVHDDHFDGVLEAHKNAGVVLDHFTALRARYRADQRIYLVMDNLSTHTTRDIRGWAEVSNVELVFTPTDASFLNRIECHFWAIGEFVIKNSDYPDWDTLTSAMTHITDRNGPHRDQRRLKTERRLLIAA